LAFLEKLIIILVILAVLVAEIFNSAIEKICDLLKPRLEERVGLIKDISAAAVFLTSVGALIIGILLFWPHIY
jgi:diacylglycerol kinase (ATP)